MSSGDDTIIDAETIGQRIREFGVKTFGTVKGFAEALDMAPSNLQKYLSGELGPGQSILVKLRRLGCDLNWLFDEKNKLSEEDAVLEIYQLKRELSIVKEEAEQYKKKLNKINKLMDE